MARRPRRTPDQIRAELVRTWRTMSQGGNCYGGFRICKGGCNPTTLLWCLGKSYDNQRCFECFVSP